LISVKDNNQMTSERGMDHDSTLEFDSSSSLYRTHEILSKQVSVQNE
jgi:hypothetical protein